MRFILASGSPRRKQLLNKVLDNFDIIPAVSDEVSQATEPTDYVAELAEHKAMEVWQSNPDSIVLGSDTVVVFDDKILGKPHSKEKAYEMLKNLSGNTHKVLTGVCIVSKKFKRTFVATTYVTFRPMSDSDIEQYIATGSCYDKAGAYGIQDSDFVSSIDGEYDNVMGLPTAKLAEQLNELGICVK